MANELLSKNITIKYAGEAIARLTGYSLEINKETVDITSFDSAGWKEFLVDLKEWNISFDGIVVRQSAADSKKDYEELLNELITNDSAVALVIEDSSTAVNISGNGFLTGLPLSGSLGDKQTMSGTIQGTGVLTVA
jgi:predicted secreted protein